MYFFFLTNHINVCIIVIVYETRAALGMAGVETQKQVGSPCPK